MANFTKILFALILSSIATSLFAETRLCSLFSDHMVLQRDQPVKIWGWDDPGKKVTVRFDGQKLTSVAGESGRWEAFLEPMVASSVGRELKISGSSKITLDDVLVGEVWHCSGQSNMQWALGSELDNDLELLMANHPEIRLITVPLIGTQVPQDDFEGQWELCNPDTAKQFSAIGYHFGKMLREIIDVPIGLIDTAWGGSAAEAWVRRELMEADPVFAADMQNSRNLEKDYDFGKKLADWEAAHSEWETRAREARESGTEVPGEPRKPRNYLTGNHRPGNIYNGVLKPIIGYTIKGTIWYQGESNASRADRYDSLFALLISSWREEWNQGDFPFYWVQLADFLDYKDEPSESNWAELREAQTLTLALPNTGQAVIYDNGEATDIHPKDKLTVARRLLRHALAKDYGMEVVADSPVYCSHEIKGDTMIIKFRNVGGGLDVFDIKELRGFSIAGEDGKHVWAEASIIDENHIAVSSPEVPRPVAVRYAWADNPVANVRSREGLLLTPFRTDAPSPSISGN